MTEPPKIENIWQDCLKSFEAGMAEGDEGAEGGATNDACSMLVFGDVGAGKWTLVNGMRKPAPKRMPEKLPGLPLSYSFVPIEEEDGPSDGYKLHAWVIDNPNQMGHFLPVALASSGGLVSGPRATDSQDDDDGVEPEPEATPEVDEAALDNPAELAPMLDRAVGVICLDLSQPWNVAESLKKWIKVISEEVEAVLKSIEAKDHVAARQLRAKLSSKVRNAKYVAPPSSSEGGDAVEGGGDGGAAGAGKASTERTAGDSMADDGYAGIPLIVVACKSDEIDSWHNTIGYEDGHTDYIKAHLRKMCLEVGAALVYTAAGTKTGINVETLRNYMLHRLTGRPCTVGLGDALDQSSTFVPAGYDTKKKVDALLEGLFGEKYSALTGKTTMFPLMDELIKQKLALLKREDKDLKAFMDDHANCTTFAAMKQGVQHWLAETIDQSMPEAEVNRVLQLGMGLDSAEKLAATEATAEVNIDTFSEKLKAAAPVEFGWVVMRPDPKPMPRMEPMPIVLDQDFWKEASTMERVEGKSSSSSSSSRASMRPAQLGAAAISKGAGGGEQASSAEAGNFFASLLKDGGGAGGASGGTAKKSSRSKKSSSSKDGKPKDMSAMFAKAGAKKAS